SSDLPTWSGLTSPIPFTLSCADSSAHPAGRAGVPLRGELDDPTRGPVAAPVSVAGARLRAMADRWAVASAEDGGALVVPLRPNGMPAAPVRQEAGVVQAVRARPDADRWVWRSTQEVYPRLLAAGIRVERCYDIEVARGLLLGHGGRDGGPRA